MPFASTDVANCNVLHVKDLFRTGSEYVKLAGHTHKVHTWPGLSSFPYTVEHDDPHIHLEKSTKRKGGVTKNTEHSVAKYK